MNDFLNFDFKKEFPKNEKISFKNYSKFFPLISVIIQRMVFSESSGVIFTADPISSNRNIIHIDCVYGLGKIKKFNLKI